MLILGAHLTGGTKASATIDVKADASAHPSNRTRPPITTHILDTSRGCPASGVEVHLETWRGSMTGRPTFKGSECGWSSLGSSHTNSDGRSGALMDIVDISPGFYRISFNTGVYNPHGFFPFVSIVFEIKESQSTEHFHVPLLLSPFSFSTYRGS